MYAKAFKGFKRNLWFDVDQNFYHWMISDNQNWNYTVIAENEIIFIEEMCKWYLDRINWILIIYISIQVR